MPSHHGGFGTLFDKGFFDAIVCGNGTSINNNITNSITITAWTNFSGAGTFDHIVSWTDGSNGTELLAYGLSGNPSFGIANGGSTASVDATSILTRNVWVFLACTYDNTTLKLYVNGVLDNSTSSSSKFAADTTTQLYIGGTHAGTAYYDGGLEGISVWNRALSDAEILQLYVEPYAGVYDALALKRVGQASIPYFMQAQKGSYALTGNAAFGGSSQFVTRSAIVPTKLLPTDGTGHPRDVAAVVNQAVRGKLNSTGFCTLTPSATSTVVYNSLIGQNSRVILFPTTAHAAAVVATTYIKQSDMVLQKSFTITHASSANTDQSFNYIILG